MTGGDRVADEQRVQSRMDVLADLLRRRRYVYASEAELQQQLADVLAAAGVPATREVRLTPHERIDLLAGDVGIEVKVKGVRVPLRQMQRYAALPQIAGLLLVTTRAATLPETIGGKPARVVSLLTNGLA